MAVDDYVREVIDRVPYDPALREQIAMEVRSHIAERMERGASEEEALAKLGDPVALAESYLAAIPLVSASFLSRLGAKLVDVVVMLAAMAPFGLLAWLAFERQDPSFLPLLLLVVCFLLIVPGFCLYTAIAEHGWSTTVGKSLFGLRVVRESGGRIGFGQALVRQLPVFLEVFLIDALFALFTDRSQRAFELVSKTRVVRAADARPSASMARHAVAM